MIYKGLIINMGRKKKTKDSLESAIVTIFLLIIGVLTWYFMPNTEKISGISPRVLSFSMEDIPEFDEAIPYVVINENIPSFEEKYFTSECFEQYSQLDELGRCGVAFANVGIETMPTEERGAIRKC